MSGVIDVYCPACGHVSDHLAYFMVSPSDGVDWRCPNCLTRFSIKVEFIPDNEEEEG